jgi:hypothetical protein
VEIAFPSRGKGGFDGVGDEDNVAVFEQILAQARANDFFVFDNQHSAGKLDHVERPSQSVSATMADNWDADRDG